MIRVMNRLPTRGLGSAEVTRLENLRGLGVVIEFIDQE